MCCILDNRINYNCDTNTFTNAKHRRTLLFQVWAILLTSDFASSSYNANHPRRTAHLVMFKISVGRDPKNPTTSSTAQIQLYASMAETQFSASIVQSQLSTDSFQNPQILRTISSVHVIHTPALFPVWGFIMTMVIVISFAHERKTAPNDSAPELFTRIVQNPTKLNDEI